MTGDSKQWADGVAETVERLVPSDWTFVLVLGRPGEKMACGTQPLDCEVYTNTSELQSKQIMASLSIGGRL